MDFHRYTFRAQKYRSSLFRLRTRKCTLSPVETQDRNVLYRADSTRPRTGHASTHGKRTPQVRRNRRHQNGVQRNGIGGARRTNLSFLSDAQPAGAVLETAPSPAPSSASALLISAAGFGCVF